MIHLLLAARVMKIQTRETRARACKRVCVRGEGGGEPGWREEQRAIEASDPRRAYDVEGGLARKRLMITF